MSPTIRVRCRSGKSGRVEHGVRRLCGVIAALPLLWLVVAGCYRQEPIRRDQLERGYVLVLPGVECHAADHAGLVGGLREAGIDCAIEIDEWGYRPFGTFPNLLSYELNRRRAALLANKIIAYRKAWPDGPITIIGFSGGGAMALFAAEALPDGFRLDRIILLGAAISPTYPVFAALAHCDRGIVNFYSPSDWFMGGFCTKLFGTMDRVKTSTAGRIGFRCTEGRLLEHDGLLQVGWIPGWRRLGHPGWHAGWRSPAWSREVLASYIRS